MKVYPLTHKIEVKLDDITLFISPLSVEQKNDISEELVSFYSTNKVRHYNSAVSLAVKYSLKDIKGATLPDGTEYKLKFDESGLTKECIEELLNTEISNKLGTICVSFLNSIPKYILGEDGNVLEGVEIIDSNP